MTKAAAKQESELFAAEKPKATVRPKTKERPVLPEQSAADRKIVAQSVRKPSTEVAVHQPKSDIALMIEAIRDPGFDPAKAKALCDLRDHEEDRALQRQKLQAEIDFNDALARAKAKMPAVVGTDRKSDKHSYATLEKVSKTMDRIVSEEGFTISYGMAESSIPDHYRITAKLSRGLHSRDYFIDLPADTKGAKGNENKTPVQGIGSTISYGRRYLKLMMFDVVVGREDDDGRGGRGSDAISEEQADDLLKLCADKGITLPMFQQAFRVEQIADLPAARFEDVKARIKTAPKQQAKQSEAAGE